MNGYIVVAGGINVDIKGKSFENMDIGSSSPGIIEISPGGVGRNIAHNLALLNLPVILLSAIGSDSQGAEVLRRTGLSGVQIDHVLKLEDCITGTYIALLNDTGEMVAALSDMRILEKLGREYFESKFYILKNASIIICDANLPVESIKYIISVADSSNIPVCLEPVSVKKALKLRDCLHRIGFITPGLDELGALTGMDPKTVKADVMASQLIKAGVQNVITSLGAKGLCYTNSSGSKYFQSIPTPVTDVTGAGDSLTAGFLYGLMKHCSIEKALLYGLAAASITVSSKETVSPLLSEERVEELVAQYSVNYML